MGCRDFGITAFAGYDDTVGQLAAPNSEQLLTVSLERSRHLGRQPQGLPLRLVFPVVVVKLESRMAGPHPEYGMQGLPDNGFRRV